MEYLVLKIQRCKLEETYGGIAFPPTPILVQSMRSPSSRNVSCPTTTPFSDATTLRQERVQPIMHARSWGRREGREKV